MSTRKRNTTGKRLAILLAQNERIFHLQDLANLWNITNNNTLRTTLKRYCQSGILFRIYKGFYSTVNPASLDPLTLGIGAIHGYCYLSTESILFLTGFISRKITFNTFVSTKSKRFSIGKNKYISRQLNSPFLYNPEGVEIQNGIKQANIYRAIADMLYFNPRFHFDKDIDWPKVLAMQKKIGYPLITKRYDIAQSR